MIREKGKNSRHNRVNSSEMFSVKGRSYVCGQLTVKGKSRSKKISWRLLKLSKVIEQVDLSDVKTVIQFH